MVVEKINVGLSTQNNYEKNTDHLVGTNDNESTTIREIASRLAIYRKLKELGHSDDTIITVYKKSDNEN
jgi:hypothetical protein